MKERLLPAARHDFDRARSHRRHRRSGQRLGVDIPLVGQPRLDHRAGAVAHRLLHDAILNRLQVTAGHDQVQHGRARRLPRQAD